jgi:Capsule assembly protein Wzi/PAP2 superfamily
MARSWTHLGFGFSLLGTLALGPSCYARPQEPRASLGADKSTDESGSSNRKTENPETSVQPTEQREDRENSVGLHLLKNIAEDQKAVWIGPKNLRWVDTEWLVPLGGAAAAMFATDTEYSKHLSNSPNRIKYSKDLSNYGLAAMVGIGGGLYVWGHLTHDDHKIETGILAGEAAVDTLAPVYALKYAFGRERPLQDNYRGRFGQGGVSFPSQHAAAAWSIASVIAHEYPGPLTSLFVYGLASAVSASRITGKQHFPSDVLVGSAIGWLEGMYVYRKHHDPRVGGGEWETYAEAHENSERSTGNIGSPYVPLDSWIYPAMERLAGLGLINDEFMGMRPWTRLECARLVDDGADQLPDVGAGSSEASGLIEALQREFRAETEEIGGARGGQFRLESLYSRTEYISGMPLTDGYNFAQTQFNDFGRPYGEGWSTVNGFSTYATRGAWTVYVRGEVQTAPSIPALPLSARQFVAASDFIPVPPANSVPAIRQFQFLDAYVGLTLSNWEVSFGRQSFLWGPGEGGPLMFSDNVTPVNVFRINRVSPLQLPSILRFLGPMRMEFFVGQLEGHKFVDTPSGVTGSWSQSLNPQPWAQGEKISLKPSPDLELGFSYMTMFAGLGVPATTGTFVNGLFDTGGDLPGGSSKSSRFTGLDFTYRIPKLRKWLTLYGDGFAHDQIIFFIDPKAKPLPLGYPERAVWRAGIYVPRLPRLPRLDLRAEGGYTDNPLGGMYSQGFYYAANRYLNGDTTNGNVLGSWMGRAGQGAQAWTNYWFSARDRIQLNFRHQKVGQQYIPGGGTLTDAGVRGDYWVRSNLSLSASVQYERWLFPVIQPNPSTNVSAAVEILFQPQKLFRRSATGPGSESGSGDQP